VHGLLAIGGQVQNCETAKAKRDPGALVRPYTSVIWPTVVQRRGHSIGHRSKRVIARGRSNVEESCDPAHSADP
jgi:hypothetical protein